MGFLLVMKAEIVRSFIMTKRYWFRTLVGILIGYGMLLVLVLGFVYSRDSVEEAFSGRFDNPIAATNFVLGFIIGMFAFGVVGMFSQGLQGMASTGVLEQLCMSPHGLISNFLARSVVSAISAVLSSGFMVWLVTKTVGGTLYFDTLPVLALLALTFVNLLGFGFMVGGLVLMFKQIGQVAVLLRMGLFAVAILAREELFDQGGIIAAAMHVMPITDAAVCLKYVLIKGQGAASGNFSSVFAHSSFFFLLANCVLWIGLGLLCFKIMENWSRARGTLGAY